jgi:glycosyltransferase involved in cell wall biosynthesis
MKDVWPKVRAQKPDARFTIVGSNPDHKISALNSRGGITVTDRVDDVRPWLAGAKVVIAPLRVARGVQNKVLEAMAMAKPVIASAEAMTGINTPEDASVIALNPDDMADAIISLLRDEARCIALGKAARDYVQEQFGWRSSLDQLDQLLAKLGVYSSSSEEGGNESSSPISATR